MNKITNITRMQGAYKAYEAFGVTVSLNGPITTLVNPQYKRTIKSDNFVSFAIKQYKKMLKMVPTLFLLLTSQESFNLYGAAVDNNIIKQTSKQEMEGELIANCNSVYVQTNNLMSK